LGIHGMGPPTAVGTGETDLTDRQISVLRAMALGDSDAALTKGLAFAEQNQIQANFETSAALSQAGVDQQKQNFLLNEKKFKLDREQFAFGRATTAQELADASRALIDPVFSAQRAAKAGDDFFIVQDQDTGAFKQVPMAGTPAFKAAVDPIKNKSSLLADINRVRTISRQIGPTRDPANPGVVELQSVVTRILIRLKDQFELGALQGPDLELLLSRFPDPTTASAVLTSSPEALEQAFASVSREVTESLLADFRTVKDFQGIPFATLNKAAQVAFGASRMDQRAAIQQEAFLSSQQFGDQETSAGSLTRQIGKPLLDEMSNIMKIIAAFGGIRAMTR